MLTRERIAGVAKGRVIQWTQWLLFLNTFAAESIFRQRDFADKSIDLQIILKMGTWAITLAFAMYFIRFWARNMLRVDKFSEVLMLLVVLVSCLYAPNIPYALAAAFSMIAVFSLFFLSSAILSNREILRNIILGSSFVSFLSLIAYYAVPDFARMKVYFEGAIITSSRLSGITGSPNSAGYIAAFCLLALYYYRRYFPQKIPVYYWILVAINCACWFLSNSRTSLAALILSITIAGMVRLSAAKLAAVFIAICSVIVFFSVVDVNVVLAMLARSGEASEITSGTSRTIIWSTVLDLVAERPLLGYGYGSGSFVLPAKSDVIGFSVTQAHNAFLQVLLVSGLVGVFFFTMVLLIKFYYALKQKDQLNVAFLCFLLIDGLTEAVAFGGTVAISTFALATVLSLKFNEKNETSYYPHQQRLSGPDAEPEDKGYSQPR
jgi:exopolysaccharide production protein ExoQ